MAREMQRGVMLVEYGSGSSVKTRKLLAELDDPVAYVPIDKRRKLAGETRLISRGFLHMDVSGNLMEAARAELKRDLRRNGRQNSRDYGQMVRETLQNFFYHKTHSRPVILPNIVRV